MICASGLYSMLRRAICRVEHTSQCPKHFARRTSLAEFLPAHSPSRHYHNPPLIRQACFLSSSMSPSRWKLRSSSPGLLVDDWHGVTDPKLRKKIQDKLAQRARTWCFPSFLPFSIDQDRSFLSCFSATTSRRSNDGTLHRSCSAIITNFCCCGHYAWHFY